MQKKCCIPLILLLLAVAAIGCQQKTTKTLPYEILVEASPFTTTNAAEEIPNLIIIASSDEISPPISGVEFSENMAEQLRKIDFAKSFAILTLVGQIPGNSPIAAITRTNNQVVIELKDYNIGPGNYAFPGFSMPYRLISVMKTDEWEQDIDFVLQEDDNVLGRVTHFIP
jgi:hypothetical protein